MTCTGPCTTSEMLISATTMRNIKAGNAEQRAASVGSPSTTLEFPPCSVLAKAAEVPTCYSTSCLILNIISYRRVCVCMRSSMSRWSVGTGEWREAARP